MLIQIRNSQNVKPRQWGPAPDVQSAIVDWCNNRHGIAAPMLAVPMWEKAGSSIHDVAGNNQYNAFDNSPTISWTGKGIYFNDDSGWTFPQLKGWDSSACTILIGANRKNTYTSALHNIAAGFRTFLGSNFFWPSIRDLSSIYHLYITCGNVSDYDTGYDIGPQGAYDFSFGAAFEGLTWYAYADGEQRATGVLTSSPDNHKFGVGGVPGSGGLIYDGFVGEVHYTYIWPVKLNNPVIALLNEQPYAMFQPRQVVFYSIPSILSATNLFDCKIIIKNSATNLADGKVVIQNTDTDLLDGKIIVQTADMNLLDGKIVVRDDNTNLLDGKVIVKNSTLDLLDGKVIIQNISTDVFDGKVVVQDDTVDLLDGKIVIKADTTDNFDGLLIIKDSATNLLDGKVEITTVGTSTDLLDGKIIVKDITTDNFDGKIIIKDVATNLLDGKVVIQTAESNLFDGKIIIKDTASNLLDGKIIIQDVATNNFDGKIVIQNIATDLFDGKIVVKNTTTDVFDGKVVIQSDFATDLFDGKIVLIALVSGLVTVSFSAKKPALTFSAKTPTITFSI